MKLLAVVEKANGVSTAHFVLFPGCQGNGHTHVEAIEDLVVKLDKACEFALKNYKCPDNCTSVIIEV